MDISRRLAIRILAFLHFNPDFIFPFEVVCREYAPEDNDFVEIEPDEWLSIAEDSDYQTFQLWLNIKHLTKDVASRLATGFLNEISGNSLERKVERLAEGYRGYSKAELSENASIEEYGYNEFLKGKTEGFEESLGLVREYLGKSGGH